MTWLSDIKLAPDGKSLELPAGHKFSADADGKVTAEKTEFMQNFDLGGDPRRKIGAESVNRLTVGKNNVPMNETVYMPKQLDMSALPRPVMEARQQQQHQYRAPQQQTQYQQPQYRAPRQQQYYAPQYQQPQYRAPQQQQNYTAPRRPRPDSASAESVTARAMRESFQDLKNDQERLDFFVASWSAMAGGDMTREERATVDRLWKEYTNPRTPDGRIDAALREQRLDAADWAYLETKHEIARMENGVDPDKSLAEKTALVEKMKSVLGERVTVNWEKLGLGRQVDLDNFVPDQIKIEVPGVREINSERLQQKLGRQGASGNERASQDGPGRKTGLGSSVHTNRKTGQSFTQNANETNRNRQL